MAKLENLHHFRAPLVLKAKLSVVLATSSKFCMSEQRLGKIQAYVKPEKSEQFDRKCQVRLNRARISAPNDSGRGGGGGGDFEME